MTSEMLPMPAHEVHCSNCKACCCRLEVLLITDTAVPDRFIKLDKWGCQTMARLEDGWCAALDRSTYKCTIYENRPWVCRGFEMGEYECVSERVANQFTADR
jgi:Fe-S-cluster containining protein